MARRDHQRGTEVAAMNDEGWRRRIMGSANERVNMHHLREAKRAFIEGISRHELAQTTRGIGKTAVSLRSD